MSREAVVTTRVALDSREKRKLAHASFVIVMEDGCASRYGLPPSGAVKVGRAGDSDIVLRDPSASRLHAWLHLAERAEIEDAGSQNGTWVAGRRLQKGERVAVASGDSIHIGSAILMLQPAAISAPRLALAAPQRNFTPALVVRDRSMQEVYDLVERVAPSNISVLILGETGVGKELVAETLHRLSGARAREPFVRINCAALSESLFESELFGHERGAFTGALRSKPGLLESARKGTVFLDEVGELPLALQPKLLRVIESREVTRVGGLQSQPIEARFVAATNRDLKSEVRAGRFRQDLFFRLSGMSIGVPPLRERTADIEPLARAFLAAAMDGLPVRTKSLSEPALAQLLRYGWPGNVRELRNVIERALLLAGDSIQIAHLPEEVRGANSEQPESERRLVSARESAFDGQRAAERTRILHALSACNGNQTRAAEYLGMPRRTLVAKLGTYEIPRPRKPLQP